VISSSELVYVKSSRLIIAPAALFLASERSKTYILRNVNIFNSLFILVLFFIHCLHVDALAVKRLSDEIKFVDQIRGNVITFRTHQTMKAAPPTSAATVRIELSGLVYVIGT
jgi:hypothetical protein